MASHAIPLSSSPSCANVGARAGDSTIGAYLSGFLAALDKPSGGNSLQTKVTDTKDDRGTSVWRCEFTIRHAAGEDEWGWGIRFDIGQSDGRVIANSFVCTGAG